MSSIGSGSAIGSPGVGNRPPREFKPAAPAPQPAPPEPALVASTVAQAAGAAAQAGNPPVDGERVAMIRKAIHNGSYPVVPAKISDAMIAAGIVLEVGK